MKQNKCTECKKAVLCRCFEIDEVEYLDKQGNESEGYLPFCSNSCRVKFEKREEVLGGDTSDFWSIHSFFCEIQGDLQRAYVERLQGALKKEQQLGTEREHFWHKRLEEISGEEVK